MNKSKINILKNYLFWIGVVMICYDLSGHFFCALARKIVFMNTLWNNYSKLIYPSISDSFRYDVHWSMWFLISVTFILIGRKYHTQL